MKKYLVRRTYEYTMDEWVEAESEKDALSVPGSENEAFNNDDTWTNSEVLKEVGIDEEVEL